MFFKVKIFGCVFFVMLNEYMVIVIFIVFGFNYFIVICSYNWCINCSNVICIVVCFLMFLYGVEVSFCEVRVYIFKIYWCM